MKNNFILLLCGLLIAMGQSALAQTPDGMTPAGEEVCDVLQGDGITKGLYGLCIAFCEAQDHASIQSALTQGDYDALFDAAPSGKILANYNKKKTDNDPAMPCIKEEPCPCWAEADLAVFDGVMNNNAPAQIAECYENGFEDFAQRDINEISGERVNVATAAYQSSTNFARCNFFSTDNDSLSYSGVFLEAPVLTLEQAMACVTSLKEFQETSTFCTL